MLANVAPAIPSVLNEQSVMLRLTIKVTLTFLVSGSSPVFQIVESIDKKCIPISPPTILLYLFLLKDTGVRCASLDHVLAGLDFFRSRERVSQLVCLRICNYLTCSVVRSQELSG